MPTAPHNFPSLRAVGEEHYRPSILLLGAGMSWGLVPLPGPLLAEKRLQAEQRLNCTATLPHDPNPPAAHLYTWAQEINDLLEARAEQYVKLAIAEALDIPTEARWRADHSTERNAPRHRVVARFARERIWEQIWSLNWDCVQESALENVGIKRNAASSPMPWPTVFNTLITAAECAQMGISQSIKVIKPHGCVIALVEAKAAKNRGDANAASAKSERFLITESELARLNPAIEGTPIQNYIFSSLCTKLGSHPFVAVGWSASEQYLLERIQQDVGPILLNPNRHPPLAADEICIIDRVFNDAGHALIADCYGAAAANAHVNVNQPDFNTDDCFLWLQATYAVDCLRRHCSPLDLPALQEITNSIEQPPALPNFFVSWADNFLPVWVRLCWRWGLVQCAHQGYPVEIDDLALESRDEHIPWTLPNLFRPELKAASRIAASLYRSGQGNLWDFDQFPGAFFRDLRLVIPIPCWGNQAQNDLRGLKALIEAIKRPGSANIDQIQVIFVSDEPADVIADATKRMLKQLIAGYLGMARFAVADQISEVELDTL